MTQHDARDAGDTVDRRTFVVSGMVSGALALAGVLPALGCAPEGSAPAAAGAGAAQGAGGGRR